MVKGVTPSTKHFVEKYNPGKVANYYHDKFNIITNNNSYEELYKAISIGTEIKIHNGFHSRNQYVAKSEYMLAFTFGKRAHPFH